MSIHQSERSGFFPDMADFKEMFSASEEETARIRQKSEELKQRRIEQGRPIGQRLARSMDSALKMADTRLNQRLNEGYRDAGERHRRKTRYTHVENIYEDDDPQRYAEAKACAQADEPDFGF